MRVLCLDLGDVRTGVAVSDAIGMTANGVKTIENKDPIPEIKKIIDDYLEEIGSVVVGLPRMMNGTIGAQGEKVMEFAERLKNEISLPVVLWDERLSTTTAEKALIESNVSRKKRKGLRDKVAATVILQNYLDSKGR
ncbi:MAG: Holliday junction resolvase RuvX [Thermodesulfovibrionia bacterium]|nr:Holliday junction resolvase RuvX [Thermodesulfovibrionia bacterium]